MKTSELIHKLSFELMVHGDKEIKIVALDDNFERTSIPSNNICIYTSLNYTNIDFGPK